VWLLDDGGKIIAVSGKDGITPQLKIENGFWWVSYDGKATWEKLGEATGGNSGGGNSAGGECMIKEITDEGSSVRFTLADDTVITIAKDPNGPDTNAVFSITYKANGGEGEDVVNEVPYGRIYYIGYTGYWGCEMDEVEFTKEGYDLVSWNTKPDGTGETFLPDYENAIVALKDMTLYAQWGVSYILTLSEEGRGDAYVYRGYYDYIEDGRYKVFGEIVIEANSYEDSEFVRWSDGNTDNPRTITITSDTTLTAIFSGGSGEGGYEDEELEVPATCTDYVDLGLPSGLKWATCNVGASSPEEYGSYFAWGEVTTNRSFTEENYKWARGFQDETGFIFDGYSKYNEEDEKNTLDSEDDAATVNMGIPWRMPTEEEVQELIDECTWTWTYDYDGTGANGYIVESKTNSNHIFLPAAGYYNGGSQERVGFYLSSSIYKYEDYDYDDDYFYYVYNYSSVRIFYVDPSSYDSTNGQRELGNSVRGVRE
ncbi:MAG: InlB B-repeat-containing protein, partial [Paludibacteraceae bacterium]|nr:InlB B-repeat-containing protein [Paludibacteraceae bacterium]